MSYRNKQSRFNQNTGSSSSSFLSHRH